MLTIADLFKMQATLNERVGLDDQRFAKAFFGHEGPAFKPEDLMAAGEWIDDMLKAMSSEIEELRDCTYWKHWSQEAQHGFRYKIKDVGAARKEVIDILHFWISLAQVLGMSPEMVGGMYSAKSAQNIKRQDDGYSIEVKDLAWQLFQENPHLFHVAPGHKTWDEPKSFEDLLEVAQDYYLKVAKAEIEGGQQDDGYSIEVKDLAWQLFKENSSSDAVWGAAESLGDLPDSTVQHYLRRAKRKLENLANLGRDLHSSLP